MNFIKKNKKLFQTKMWIKRIKSEKYKILISLIWWIWFLSISVLWLNIIHNPVVEDKIFWNLEENILEWSKIFHGSAKNFFSWKKIFLSKNFYLINAVEKISEIYQENWKISFENYEEKELFLRKIAKKYTLENISEFRKNSTAEENVEKFSWRLLNKTLPVWFEVDMGELEWIFVSNINK